VVQSLTRYHFKVHQCHGERPGEWAAFILILPAPEAKKAWKTNAQAVYRLTASYCGHNALSMPEALFWDVAAV
jgi:hypothetical protein